MFNIQNQVPLIHKCSVQSHFFPEPETKQDWLELNSQMSMFTSDNIYLMTYGKDK